MTTLMARRNRSRFFVKIGYGPFLFFRTIEIMYEYIETEDSKPYGFYDGYYSGKLNMGEIIYLGRLGQHYNSIEELKLLLENKMKEGLTDEQITEEK